MVLNIEKKRVDSIGDGIQQNSVGGESDNWSQ